MKGSSNRNLFQTEQGNCLTHSLNFQFFRQFAIIIIITLCLFYFILFFFAFFSACLTLSCSFMYGLKDFNSLTFDLTRSYFERVL